MAKIIYGCFRSMESPPGLSSMIHRVCQALTPEQLIQKKPLVLTDNGIFYGIMNESPAISVRGKSVLLGQLYEERDWETPCGPRPDGSYALFRSDNQYLELLSDRVASRTIWYYQDEELFLASSSQRAIIQFLGSFEFDSRVIPWVLSTGTLGPSFCWDSRIRRLPNATSLQLKRTSWKSIIKRHQVEFVSNGLSESKNRVLLDQAIQDTFANLKIDPGSWLIPLSGGYDSRSILYYLSEAFPGRNLRTITWGLKNSVTEKGNDAFLAGKLAAFFGSEHEYHHTDFKEKNAEEILLRFILNGEGRTDNFSAYMDSFRMWKNLYERGISGIIRGDEAFGVEHGPIRVLRMNMNMPLCDDYKNLSEYEKWNMIRQEIPRDLLRRSEESLPAWRDRMMIEYEMPVVFAALSDLKLSYVEQICPLLSERILNQVMQMPDSMRTDKKLFRKLVNSKCSDIPFARTRAIEYPTRILNNRFVLEYMLEELSGQSARGLFHAEFLNNIRKAFQVRSDQRQVKQTTAYLKCKELLPISLKTALRGQIRPILDPCLLAFRALMIKTMKDVLTQDAVMISPRI
jgi:asparagine synthetase B (glutamine-hydrolysing)